MQHEMQMQRTRLASLGEIAGGLAHEINNTLQPILGLSEIMGRRLDKMEECEDLEQLKNYNNVIHQSGMHARKIVENVLAFARGEKTTQNLYPATQLFKEAIAFAREMTPQSIEINDEALQDFENETDQNVIVNKTSITQIIGNLVKNAAFAMEQKGTITITAHIQTLNDEKTRTMSCTQGTYVVLDITDEGCGMDEKTLKQIFNPFFSTRDISEGTGLGLSMAYGVLSNLGGAITAQSNPGLGSTFSLYFPLATKEDAQKIRTASEERNSG